jgi:hypothetical protein
MVVAQPADARRMPMAPTLVKSGVGPSHRRARSAGVGKGIAAVAAQRGGSTGERLAATGARTGRRSSRRELARRSSRRNACSRSRPAHRMMVATQVGLGDAK